MLYKMKELSRAEETCCVLIICSFVTNSQSSLALGLTLISLIGIVNGQLNEVECVLSQSLQNRTNAGLKADNESDCCIFHIGEVEAVKSSFMI